MDAPPLRMSRDGERPETPRAPLYRSGPKTRSCARGRGILDQSPIGAELAASVATIESTMPAEIQARASILRG
jgi:hypothetical protein